MFKVWRDMTTVVLYKRINKSSMDLWINSGRQLMKMNRLATIKNRTQTGQRVGNQTKVLKVNCSTRCARLERQCPQALAQISHVCPKVRTVVITAASGGPFQNHM